MIKRFLYWIKSMSTGERDCKGFCVSCNYYETCKND